MAKNTTSTRIASLFAKRSGTTYEVRGHGRRGYTVTEKFASRAAAVRAAKRALGGGYASRWADGAVGIYSTLSDMRRDQTGEHAAYVVDVVGSAA